MQFQVPQFIETEDKIVGPFTLRQFLYIVTAGGISFVLYFTVQFWLFILLTTSLLAVAMGFAFLKIEGRPLSRVFLSALNFYWRPQTYLWQLEPTGIEKKEGLAGGLSLEDIVAGAALRSVWRSLQTGIASPSPKKELEFSGRFQIFQKLSGERKAARRVDYR